MTLFLRGVQPAQVVQNYRNGKYLRIGFSPNKLQVPELSNQKVVLSKSGTSNNNFENLYIISLPGKGAINYATNNCEAFKLYMMNGELKKSGHCHYCHRDFSWTPIGIIISMIEVDNWLPAYFEGENCTFECADAELDLRKNSGLAPSRRHYADAEKNLRTLFQLCYPGKVLRRAMDYKLLKRLGGWMSDEEFYAGHHIYRIVPQIILAPLKNVYQEQKNS